MAPSLRGLSVSKKHVIASQCAHWRGNPYPLQGGALRVPSAHRRPLGVVSLYERQRERIATPACGLVRDDIYILGFFYSLQRPPRWEGVFWNLDFFFQLLAMPSTLRTTPVI